jgi:hypothetical protein
MISLTRPLARDAQSDRNDSLMVKSKSYTLYVNLSASKVRKRLKDYGFGGRDIQASDRNQGISGIRVWVSELRQLQTVMVPTLVGTESEPYLETHLLHPAFGNGNSITLMKNCIG